MKRASSTFPPSRRCAATCTRNRFAFSLTCFQRDGSLLDMLDSDHTFLNQALAEFYGIPGITGPEWRRVDGIRQYGRGGHPRS